MKAQKHLPVVLIGGGGHAKVLAECLQLSGRTIMAIADPKPGAWALDIPGVKILSSDEDVFKISNETCELVNAVGSTKTLTLRKRIYEKFDEKGFTFASVIHPSSIVSPNAKLSPGVQIMAGAIVQAGTRIGINTIVNTGAIVDHDGNIGEHVHVAPGATLSGNVRVGSGTHVGAAAVIIQSIVIGSGCLIAAGAVVISSIEDSQAVAGVPAKYLKVK